MSAAFDSKSRSGKAMIVVVGCLIALTNIGCGAAQEQPAQDVDRLEQRVKDAEQKAADAQATAAAAADQAEETSDAAVDSDPATTSGCIKVPDVVGKDHQLAQDTMQAAGLYMLQEQDASGQGRMLLVDRNWTTVRQRPSAGKCVSEDTEIMLYAVKDGER